MSHQWEDLLYMEHLDRTLKSILGVIGPCRQGNQVNTGGITSLMLKCCKTLLILPFPEKITAVLIDEKVFSHHLSGKKISMWVKSEILQLD